MTTTIFFLHLEIKSMAHLGNENLNSEAQILIFSFYFSIYEMTNLISHCFLTIFFEESKTLLMCSSMLCVLGCLCACSFVHVCVHAYMHSEARGECLVFSLVSSLPYLLWWDLSRNLELDAG